MNNATALDQGYVAFDLAPGAETTMDVGYTSRGMGTWLYRFGNDVTAVNDFTLAMTTDFGAIDFPPQTLLPDPPEERDGKGWRLHWHYATLVTGNGVGMAFPYPLQPGPLAQRITFWAPVALFFYFFVMLVITSCAASICTRSTISFSQPRSSHSICSSRTSSIAFRSRPRSPSAPPSRSS